MPSWRTQKLSGPLGPPGCGKAGDRAVKPVVLKAEWRWLLARIFCDPEIMMGKPTVEGTRITVESLLEKVASGYTQEELLKAHPRLTIEGIRAAFDFAAQSVRNDIVYPTAT